MRCVPGWPARRKRSPSAMLPTLQAPLFRTGRAGRTDRRFALRWSAIHGPAHCKVLRKAWREAWRRAPSSIRPGPAGGRGVAWPSAMRCGPHDRPGYWSMVRQFRLVSGRRWLAGSPWVPRTAPPCLAVGPAVPVGSNQASALALPSPARCTPTVGVATSDRPP